MNPGFSLDRSWAESALVFSWAKRLRHCTDSGEGAFARPQMPSEIGCLTRAEPGVIGTSYEDLRGFWAVGCLWLSCTPSERLIRADARGAVGAGGRLPLTVHKIGVTGALRKTLQTTNPIESAFDTVGRFSGRVKRWNGAKMVMRWVGSGLIQAREAIPTSEGIPSHP